MHPYVIEIEKFFGPHADPIAAVPMKAYMRNQFEFLGISSGGIGELRREFLAAHGLPALNELEPVLRELWGLPQREYQYTAIGILADCARLLPADFSETLEYLLVNKSWWDTVDTLAGGTVGIHFKRFPEVRDRTLAAWRRSNNIWLRRTCILFQLSYKKDTDFDLLKEIIHENLGSKEFFINKAIGWALRTYSRVDAQAVRAFVAATPLHPLSAREALKWLDRQEEKNALP